MKVIPFSLQKKEAIEIILKKQTVLFYSPKGLQKTSHHSGPPATCQILKTLSNNKFSHHGKYIWI